LDYVCDPLSNYEREFDEVDVFDPLSKISAHGHGIDGYCIDCRHLFQVSVAALITERGGDSRVAGMRLICPGCGGTHTTFSVTAPGRSALKRA